MPNVFSSDSTIYAAVGCTSYLSSCAHRVVGDWGRQLVSLSPANNKFLASLGLLLSSPRSVPSLLELHHFFLLLPRPPIGCRSSSCCASIPSANATGAHASPPLFSSPSPSPARPLPLRPARGDSDVNQGTTVRASDLSPPSPPYIAVHRYDGTM